MRNGLPILNYPLCLWQIIDVILWQIKSVFKSNKYSNCFQSREIAWQYLSTYDDDTVAPDVSFIEHILF